VSDKPSAVGPNPGSREVPSRILQLLTQVQTLAAVQTPVPHPAPPREELLYLHYSKLDPWSLLDLMKFFGEEDYWRLFRRVGRRLGVGRCTLGEQREALRHGL